MVVTKQKKHKRFRGHRTYHGAHRNWRGGGNRGGRGNAGGHKHKWSYVVKYDKDRYGKHGFKRPPSTINVTKSINLNKIEDMINYFVEKKFAEKDGSATRINLTAAGYEKVLGSGKVTRPMIIEAKGFSKLAEKKLSEAGGKAVKV